MSRIWSMMDVGRRSMMNSQTALQTVSHNIANKSTDGYSRQRVELQSNPPIGQGRLQIGTGSRATKIIRINNPYLERQIEQEQNNLGFSEARQQALSRVEEVYNEQVNKGINRFMTDFFNSWRELSNSPESLASRTQVKEAAKFLTNDFKRAYGQLTSVQTDIDYQIRTQVEHINEITKEIAKLNEKVQIVELNNVPANDERDRRDELIKRLSEKVNIRYAEGKDGTVTITAGNAAVLVSGYSYRPIEVASTPGREGKREGNFDLFYRSTDSSTPVRITDQITGGALGGMLDVRDDVVNGFLRDLDELAYELTYQVNRAHVEGFNRYSSTGVNFFDSVQEVDGAAINLNVNEKILTDVGLIAAAATPNSPGDNRISNVIHQLQSQKIMREGSTTFDDFYNSMVGRAGIEANRANSSLESQQDIIKQLKNMRESISGVSLDEETTKLIQFQKSFDASAKMIKAADEMMDTVLNLRR
ncbi:MAG: flagellar hook-associated protein FlgK [Pseudobdellovibrionaceae bacterium]|nr:flagellar hook-associated protein FlgK [Bdellovibrionales bacterium]USN46480.1 MAG: flagellar hook-associated protein FlgK [Pseudobdellovibrionaceae bacterium]